MNTNLHHPTSTSRVLLSALFALGALTGCPSEEPEIVEIDPPDASGEPDAGEGDAGGEVEAPLPSADWCDRIVAGPSAGSGAAAIDLARAHALVRFFGVHEGYVDADTALAGALEGWSDPSAVPDLSAYARALPGVWDQVAAGQGILINEQLARRHEYAPGDTLTLAPDWSAPIASATAALSS